MKRPNLFLAGAPKAGTTSLYYYLDQHPDVYMSPVKEPDYFNPDYRHAGSFTSEADYLALFDEASDERWVGEASVWYLYSQDCPSRIHGFSEDSRILISIRNPIDMMYSRYYELRMGGLETAKTFESALRLEEERMKGLDKNPSDTRLKKLLYRPYCDYAKFIRGYYGVFGKSNVYVIIFEEFIETLRSTYGDLCRFLEIDQGFVPDFAKLNPSRKRRSRIYGWMLDRVPRGLAVKLRKIIPLETQRSVYKTLKELNAMTVSRPPLGNRLRSQLSREVEPYVRSIENLWGQDLAVWDDW